jgi:hypothetical protein
MIMLIGCSGHAADPLPGTSADMAQANALSFQKIVFFIFVSSSETDDARK